MTYNRFLQKTKENLWKKKKSQIARAYGDGVLPAFAGVHDASFL